MGMSLFEIAAVALDEWENVHEDVMADAQDADGVTTPQGPTAPKTTPTNATAAKLQFSLQQHDDQYHGGQAPKGECKYRDRVMQQAKALGVAGQMTNPDGSKIDDGGIDDKDVKESAEWKQYVTDRQVQDTTYAEKLKALGIENPQMNGSVDNEEQKKALDEWRKAVDARRDKYLKDTLGDAEAHCVEQLATIIDAGGEKAEKAVAVAQEILNRFTDKNDPRNVGAQKMLDRAERKKHDDEYSKKIADLEAQVKELKEGKKESDNTAEQPSDDNQNFGETKVGRKTYVDLSGMGFWEGMKEAFKAGWEGKEIVTDWDKMSGRWDKIREKMTKAQKKDYDGLTNGLASYLQKQANEAAAANFEKYLGEGSKLTDEQKAYVAQLYADWSGDDAKKSAKLKELNRYLAEQGIIVGKDGKKNGTFVGANEEWTYVPDGDATHEKGGCMLAPNDSKTATLDSVPDIGGDAETGVDVDNSILTIVDVISNEFQPMEQAIGNFDNNNTQVKVNNSETVISAPIKHNLPTGHQGVAALQKALRRRLDPQTVVRENGSNLDIVIPNKKAGVVSFKKMIGSPEWKNIVSSKGGLQVPVGMNDDGTIAHFNLADSNSPHVFVVGRTGMGKTQGLQGMINGMMATYSPEDVQFDIIDPKGTDFTAYEGMKNGHVRSVVPASKAKDKLLWYVNEMESRYNHLKKNGTKDLLAYNAKVGDQKDTEGNKLKMPHLVLTCDEVADMRSSGDPDIDNLLARIAQKGRAAGIHLMLGSQRADRKTSLPGMIQGNIGHRIIFSTQDQTDARLASGLTGDARDAVPSHTITSPGSFYMGTSGNPSSFKKGKGAFMGKNNEVTEAIANQYKDE